jgi:hypothetical protein
MNKILELAIRQKNEIARVDGENLKRISEVYAVMYDRVQGDIDALVLAIEALDKPTSAQVKALPQYKRLISRAEVELDRFTVYLETTIESAATAAIGLGLADSAALVKAMGVKMTSLEPAVMRPLLSYLQEGGALYKRLQQLTGATVDKVIASIVDGVGQGFNPRKIAGLIQDSFGGGLTDALRNVRTVQIKSYQDSARANYMASDVVTQWIWFAELDSDVCLSCVAMHGTIHELDETLDDHYNGRCSALPYIPEFGNPVETTGQAWFEGLPEAQQKEMMGDLKYQAWSDGKFEFSKLSQDHENDVYGNMKSEASLKSLIGEE